MTEAELKAIVVKKAHDAGWRVYSAPMVKALRPVKGASGYPDLTMARMGRVVWIELKQTHGVLSPDQMQWLRDIGPACNVIRPEDIADGNLDRLLA